MKRHIYAIIKTKLSVIQKILLKILNAMVYMRYLEIFASTVKQRDSIYMSLIQFIRFVATKFNIFLIKEQPNYVLIGKILWMCIYLKN